MNKIDVLRRLLKIQPKSAETLYLLGLESKDQGLFVEASQAFSEALDFCDDSLRNQILEAMEELPTESPKECKDETQTILPFRLINGTKANISPEHQVRFEDVGGLEPVKDSISIKIIQPFLKPALFEKYKSKSGGGILMYGPPGCGKTYLARATAGECNATFVPVHISDVLNPYMGESAKSIRGIFEYARASRPSIIFIDEIDSIGFSRSKSSSEQVRSMVEQLLTEMEGIESNTDQVLVIGATNMPWDVDGALKRPGRFDRMFFIPPPDLDARTAIFKLKAQDKPVELCDFPLLAEMTEMYSGADIDFLFEAASEAVLVEILHTGIERLITQEDLESEIKRHLPSTVEWLRTIKNYVKYANQSGLYNDVSDYIRLHSEWI